MAVSSEALTTKVATGTPYQLSNDQVTRASKALLRHIKEEEKKRSSESDKKNLLADSDDSDAEDVEDVPVWLILTTKKHIVDKNRLKPGKIPVPNSLHTAEDLSICLITADPQRAVKDVVADPEFPTSLSSRITKIIGFSKLKDRYKSFESRRQLLAEHDVFLADERIILRLVKTLGKTFFKSSKRPVPVRIEEIQKVGGKRVKKDDKKRPPTDEKYAAVASPKIVAREIERTLNAVPVHLAPAATAAVRVGLASFTPEKLTQNIEAVVAGMVDKYVTKGWKNIKAIHVKGPNTMALPIWLASELWVEEGDVKEAIEGEDTKAIEGAKKSGKKRKSTADAEEKKAKKSKSTAEDNEDAELIAARRKKLKDQKAKALKEGAADTVKVSAIPSDGAAKSAKKKRKSTA